MNNQGKQFNIKSYDPEDLQRVLEYWTPEKITKAKPISPKKITKEELSQYSENQVENSFKENEIIMLDNLDKLPILGEPYEVDVDIFPYNVGGKFLFTSGEGEDAEDYVGTAQFIGHCQMILTAAHCIKNEDTGEEFKNFVFARAYRNVDGHIEQQLFSIERVGTVDGTGRYAHLDYAFCRTTESYPGRTLALKIGDPAPEGHPMKAIGYPGDSDIMLAVEGNRGKIVGTEHFFEMKGNPFGPGSSGGAMMVDLEIQGRMWRNLVIGLNSRSYRDDETIEISPLFDQRTIQLYNKVLDRSVEHPRRCDTL